MRVNQYPVAIITGADRGIGRAISECLAGGYINTVLISNDLSGLEIVRKNILSKNKGDSISICLDVSDSQKINEAVKDIVNKYGRIDYLINVAGVAHFGGVELCTEDQWDETINTNVKGYFLMTKAVFPHMKNVKEGAIINMSSVWGVRGAPSMLAYSTSKFAVEGFTKCLVEEAKPYGIKVTSIILDKVDTSFRDKMSKHVEFSHEQKQRMLDVSDVADAVKWVLNSSPRTLPSSITLDAFMWK
ncbi:MAG: SDR family oxidoreductase [Gammaproteobacteria bacterium]